MASGKAISALESAVRRFVVKRGLDQNPRPLVLGVSGGPDSLSMLHAFHRLPPSLGLRLHVAHFNHGLRARESDADAEFVQEQASTLGLPVTVEKQDVKSRVSGHSGSLEEKAREARYGFLARVAREVNAIGVAVAHTADDQAETVLMHILRGAGLRGLRGMPQVLEVEGVFTLFRPLLGITRAQTEAYCRALGLAPRIDHTNLEPVTLRNRIRLELLPELRHYNPRISESLLRLAESAALDISYIDPEVEEAWARVGTETAEGVSISRIGLSGLHPAIRRRALLRALESASGGPVDIEGVHVASLESLLHGDTGGEAHLPKGIHALLGYESIVLSRAATPPPTPLPIEEQPIAVPGKSVVGPWIIEAEILESVPETRDPDPLCAHLDFDRLPGAFAVRRRRDGDAFTPLGMSGSKKLQDFLTDAKVPRESRDSVPIVVSGGRIVWVAGHRLGEEVKVTPETSRVLRLRVREG